MVFYFFILLNVCYLLKLTRIFWGFTMKKFYEKNELMFSIFWIIVYVVGASAFDELSKLVNLEKSLTFAFLFVLSLIFVIWILKNNLAEKYGLCKPKYAAKNFLYYIPLLVLLTVNFWFGINLQLSVAASIFYILTMLCVGFVEEIIFRGFLFRYCNHYKWSKIVNTNII